MLFVRKMCKMIIVTGISGSDVKFHEIFGVKYIMKYFVKYFGNISQMSQWFFSFSVLPCFRFSAEKSDPAPILHGRSQE